MKISSIATFSILLISAIAFVILSFFLVDFHEDAAILFRYSVNLAETGVISYNPGGPPVEGATDFLYMAMIAALNVLGFDPFLASLLLNFAALILSVHILRQLFELDNIETIALFAAHLGVTSMFATIVGFSVFVFEAAILTVVYFAVKGKPAQFFLSVLAMCLIRPDGVLFGAVLSCWMAWSHRPNGGMRAIVLFLILPGLAYFSWRTWYFGEFLPLPFYVKSDAVRDILGLFVLESILSSFQSIIPSLVALPLAVGYFFSGRIEWKLKTSIILSLLMVPLLFYSSMNLEQNISNRFFHFVPVVAFCLIADTYVQRSIRAASFLTVALAFFLMDPFHSFRLRNQLTSIDLATELRAVDGDLSLAVTEAGHIPYHSGAESVDLWGLNSKRFARSPATGADISETDFDLIVLHAPGFYSCDAMSRLWETSRADPPDNALGTRDWIGMVRSVLSGTDPGHYTLFSVPFVKGSGLSRHDMFLVNTAGENAGAIAAVIAQSGASACKGSSGRLGADPPTSQ